MLKRGLLALAVILATTANTVVAEGQTSRLAAAKPAKAASTKPAKPASMQLEQMLYLVRSQLLTLNDANKSGNYTVLRDLAAPDFQARNSAADLAQAFADLRGRNFDLYGAALLAPQLKAAPSMDKDRRLRLVGYFPTRPLRIDFDLTFQSVGGQWRLYRISISTPEAVVAQAAPAIKHGTDAVEFATLRR